VRYDADRVGDPSGLLAPPYNDLDPAWTRELRRHPHHVARLLYTDTPQGAARELGRWLRRGVLRRDDRPALYVYQQQRGARILQRGLIGDLLLPRQAGRLLPHEAVSARVVRQRAAHMSGFARPTGAAAAGPPSHGVDDCAARGPCHPPYAGHRRLDRRDHPHLVGLRRREGTRALHQWSVRRAGSHRRRPPPPCRLPPAERRRGWPVGEQPRLAGRHREVSTAALRHPPRAASTGSGQGGTRRSRSGPGSATPRRAASAHARRTHPGRWGTGLEDHRSLPRSRAANRCRTPP
jgi:hypothetical protein